MSYNLKAISFSLLSFYLVGCANLSQRLALVGDSPQLSRLENPTLLPEYRPVTMPMPSPHPRETPTYNSLWEAGSRAFFKDQRAHRVGDILTIQININNDQAAFSIKPNISVTKSGSLTVSDFFGLNDKLGHLFPKKYDPNNMAIYQNKPQSTGSSEYKRTDTVKFNIAAIVTQILPNGNMVISGRQEVRVSDEVRDLAITGVIRREDIASNNTISAEKIAEARILYGGRGDLSDSQKLAWGQQLLNKVSPW